MPCPPGLSYWQPCPIQVCHQQQHVIPRHVGVVPGHAACTCAQMYSQIRCLLLCQISTRRALGGVSQPQRRAVLLKRTLPAWRSRRQALTTNTTAGYLTSSQVSSASTNACTPAARCCGHKGCQLGVLASCFGIAVYPIWGVQLTRPSWSHQG